MRRNTSIMWWSWFSALPARVCRNALSVGVDIGVESREAFDDLFVHGREVVEEGNEIADERFLQGVEEEIVLVAFEFGVQGVEELRVGAFDGVEPLHLLGNGFQGGGRAAGGALRILPSALSMALWSALVALEDLQFRGEGPDQLPDGEEQSRCGRRARSRQLDKDFACA